MTLRLLLSYHYHHATDLARVTAMLPPGTMLFADSGAFSAMTKGQAVDPAEYVAWVQKWGDHLAVASGPDVIGDPLATARETDRMAALLAKTHPRLAVLPVYHVGEEWRWLDRACASADYIALGGMVPLAKSAGGLLRAWCAKAFERIPPHVKVHGFGMTNWQLLRDFPWWSADSSSWVSAFLFGSLNLFDPAKGAWVEFDLRQPKKALPHARLLATYGMRPTDLRSKGYDMPKLVAASIAAWQRAERWLQAQRAANCPQLFQASSGKRDPNFRENVSGGIGTIAAAVADHPELFMVTGRAGNSDNGPEHIGGALPAHPQLFQATGKPVSHGSPEYVERAHAAHPELFLVTQLDVAKGPQGAPTIAQAVEDNPQLFMATAGSSDSILKQNSPQAVAQCMARHPQLFLVTAAGSSTGTPNHPESIAAALAHQEPEKP